MTSNGPKTILIVDDIPLMRTMLVKYINTIGTRVLREEFGVEQVEVLEAEDGAAALETARSHPVDLIFLDLMMPGMDGIGFLEEKRKDPAIAGIPVVVCSAVGEKNTVEKAKTLGAQAYITKPFTLKSVEGHIRDIMRVVLQ